jgi:hypothetical protein
VLNIEQAAEKVAVRQPLFDQLNRGITKQMWSIEEAQPLRWSFGI